MQFAAEAQLIVTGSDDRFVKIWDTKSKNYQAVQSMQPFKDTVMSVSVSPARPEICGGSVDGTGDAVQPMHRRLSSAGGVALAVAGLAGSTALAARMQFASSTCGRAPSPPTP